MILNLNREWLIRERPRGVEEFDQYYGKTSAFMRRTLTQPDGRLRMSFLEVANIYGHAITMNKEPPIDMEAEVADPSKEGIPTRIAEILEGATSWEVVHSRPAVPDKDALKPGPVATVTMRVRYDGEPLKSLDLEHSHNP